VDLLFGDGIADNGDLIPLCQGRVVRVSGKKDCQPQEEPSKRY